MKKIVFACMFLVMVLLAIGLTDILKDNEMLRVNLKKAKDFAIYLGDERVLLNFDQLCEMDKFSANFQNDAATTTYTCTVVRPAWSQFDCYMTDQEGVHVRVPCGPEFFGGAEAGKLDISQPLEITQP